jgi:hypothetical protein
LVVADIYLDCPALTPGGLHFSRYIAGLFDIQVEDRDLMAQAPEAQGICPSQALATTCNDDNALSVGFCFLLTRLIHLIVFFFK